MHLAGPGAQRFYLIPPSEMARQRACQPGHGADCLAAQDEYLGARVTYALKPWSDFADAWGSVVRAMMGDVDVPFGDSDSSLPPPRLGALPRWFLKRELRAVEKEEEKQLEKRLEKELLESQSCPAGSCFVGSTPVHTAEGPRSISTIAIGDWVWAEDPETGETTLRQVLHTSIRFDEPLWAVVLDDGQGSAETLKVTSEHPFWTRRGWVRVDGLRPSDEIEHRAGWWSRVFEARQTDERAPVYNLVVEGLHTYFVGASGVLVHNGCPCPTDGAVARIMKVERAESPIWKGLENAGHNGRKTSGSGRFKRYYEWDGLHGEIEMYDRKGKHLGVLDPMTGEVIKPAVKGRKIDL